MTQGLAILATLIVLYAAVAVKLGRWSISMPMVFVVVGFLLGPRSLGIINLSVHAEEVKALTEVTLALLLFSDASTINLRQARDDAQLPVRLLTIGILLTIVLGALVAFLLLPGEGLAFAALLAAILAPTDAALGLPIFNSPLVPVRIRRALNIESGLNDGIATPFVSLFIAFAISTEGSAGGGWLVGALAEIALGVLVGIALGVAGGRLVELARRRGWTSGGMEQIAILGLGGWLHTLAPSRCMAMASSRLLWVGSPLAMPHAPASPSQPSLPRRSVHCSRCWYGRCSGVSWSVRRSVSPPTGARSSTRS
jgi:NhaP-type Na+/H+ or K+/H+ antiporter